MTFYLLLMLVPIAAYLTGFRDGMRIERRKQARRLDELQQMWRSFDPTRDPPH